MFYVSNIITFSVFNGLKWKFYGIEKGIHAVQLLWKQHAQEKGVGVPPH